MHVRAYDPQQDKEAIRRIWRETGWLKKDQDGTPQDLEAEAGRSMVALIEGSAECLVSSAPGTLRYLDEDLPLSAVTGVTTSRIARKQGLAARALAALLAEDAQNGAWVAALGMFEQGFYNRLGFGTSSYEHTLCFDPARLRVGRQPRVPRRLTADDWEAVHATRLRRRRGHGSVSITPAAITRAVMLGMENGFGLGYYDGPDGELTHCLWCGTDNVGHGPYNVEWMAYQTGEQFLELIALLQSLGDQVHLVRLDEPPGIQLQDLVDQPFKQRRVSSQSPFAAGVRTAAWQQARICDLGACLARTHLEGEPLRFGLRLRDPIEPYLPPDAPWRGVAGAYSVTLGPESRAEPGIRADLPTLEATVNAFTRLWLGVQPASGLAITDDIAGPPELLAALDRRLRLPAPHMDWNL